MAGICRPTSVTVGPSVAVSAYTGAMLETPSTTLASRPTELLDNPLSRRSASGLCPATGPCSTAMRSSLLAPPQRHVLSRRVCRASQPTASQAAGPGARGHRVHPTRVASTLRRGRRARIRAPAACSTTVSRACRGRLHPFRRVTPHPPERGERLPGARPQAGRPGSRSRMPARSASRPSSNAASARARPCGAARRAASRAGVSPFPARQTSSGAARSSAAPSA
jgi:hypothetical protein